MTKQDVNENAFSVSYGMNLLPDRDGTDPSGHKAGVTQLTESLSSLGERLVWRNPADNPEKHKDRNTYRGLLAFALLLDTWAEETAEIRIRRLDEQSSLLAKGTQTGLDARVNLVMLVKNGQSCVLGLLSAAEGLIPSPACHVAAELMPERAEWYNRQTECFGDPLLLLDRHDRTTLCSRLQLLKKAAGECCGPELKSFCSDAEALLERERACPEMTYVLEAIYGLAPDRISEHLTVHTLRYRSGVHNAVMDELVPRNERHDRMTPPVQVYAWKGIRFARTCTEALAEPYDTEDHEEQIGSIRALCDMLASSSSAWRNSLLTRLREAEVKEKALTEEAAQALHAVREHMAQYGNGNQALLRWPWHRAEEAAVYLGTEKCGAAFRSVMHAPFLDMLTVIPGEFGNPAMGAALDAGNGERVLLPFDISLIRYLGHQGFRPEAFRVSRLMNGSMQVRFAVNEALTLERIYVSQEIIMLPAAEVPDVRVWPWVNLPQDRWHGWYTMCSQNAVTCVPVDQTPGEPYASENGEWNVVRTEEAPDWFVFRKGDVLLGCTYDAGERYAPPENGSAMINIDFGMTGTAYSVTINGATQPLTAVLPARRVLSGRTGVHPDTLVSEQFGSILTSGIRMQRSGADPLLCASLLQPQGVEWVDKQQETGLYTSVISPVDRRGSTARRLFLKQTAMEAALAAMLLGVSDLHWNIALEDDLTIEAVENRISEWSTAVGEVMLENGIRPTAGEAVVRFTPAPEALYIYQRNTVGMQSAVVLVNIGAMKTCMTLRLRGMERTIDHDVSALGGFSMLFDTWMMQPRLLKEDFADAASAGLRRDAELLAASLDHSAGRQSALEKNRLMIEVFLGQYLQEIGEHIAIRSAQGRPTVTGALLSCGFAQLMLRVGHMLEKVRRDSTMNDYLPGEVMLYLAGRGSLLLRILPEQVRQAMSVFVRLPMSSDHPMQRMSLVFSESPKMEIALGMGSVDPSIPPILYNGEAAMIPCMQAADFLLSYRAWLPMDAMRLFPGFTIIGRDGRIYLNDEMTFRAVVNRCFRQDVGTMSELIECISLLRRPEPIMPEPEETPSEPVMAPETTGEKM